MANRLQKLTDGELLPLAWLGFLCYWAFLLLSWPPLRGFISRLIGMVM